MTIVGNGYSLLSEKIMLDVLLKNGDIVMFSSRHALPSTY